ncbi:Cdc2 kinase, putative [Medicago truncatula]|uniref:Cdc2 kinase, putative n=1 Tax=Medicago truncatula TaxID=3880 RepID=G7IDS6_MEDTR|nr:Cdc2 kinase, putative [Medicago truncatula]
MAAPGQLNIIESPSRGSCSVDCSEKLEQIGEGTYRWLRGKGAGREGFGNIVQLFLHVFSKLILGREGRCVEVVQLVVMQEVAWGEKFLTWGPEQLNKIFDLCGGPDEVNWPGVAKTPCYNQFKPTRPMKRRGKILDSKYQITSIIIHRAVPTNPEARLRNFDRHALELLEKMLTLDPAQRIPAKGPLDAEYFWIDPLTSDPKSLPKYDSSHEFQTKKKRQRQRQNEENVKRLKMQHPLQDTRLPRFNRVDNMVKSVAAGHSHHYGKPRGPSGGPGWYPPGGNLSEEYNHPNRGGQGGGAGYGSGPYPPQGRGAPYGSSGCLQELVVVRVVEVALELELQIILKVVLHMVDRLLVMGIATNSMVSSSRTFSYHRRLILL